MQEAPVAFATSQTDGDVARECSQSAMPVSQAPAGTESSLNVENVKMAKIGMGAGNATKTTTQGRIRNPRKRWTPNRAIL